MSSRLYCAVMLLRESGWGHLLSRATSQDLGSQDSILLNGRTTSIAQADDRRIGSNCWNPKVVTATSRGKSESWIRVSTTMLSPRMAEYLSAPWLWEFLT